MALRTWSAVISLSRDAVGEARLAAGSAKPPAIINPSSTPASNAAASRRVIEKASFARRRHCDRNDVQFRRQCHFQPAHGIWQSLPRMIALEEEVGDEREGRVADAPA